MELINLKLKVIRETRDEIELALPNLFNNKKPKYVIFDTDNLFFLEEDNPLPHQDNT